MTVKLLTENHFEFLSLKGGCIGSSESTLVKTPHFWKSHVTAQIVFEVCDQVVLKPFSRPDPGFLERGFISKKVVGIRFDDFISFFLSIP